MIVSQIKGEGVSVTLSSSDLTVEGNHFTFTNWYLKSSISTRKIPLKDILQIQNLTMRNKKYLMAFCYLSFAFLLAKSLIKKFTVYAFIKTSGFLSTLKLGIAFLPFVSIGLLVMYLYSKKNYLDISYVGGRVCISANALGKQGSTQDLISKFYTIR